MTEDRAVKINIGKKEYEMILTTKAVKEISKRYGGLSELGDKLLKSENFEMAISEIVWLIALLINQSIAIYNFENKTKEELITEEEIELLTTPFDLALFKDAIMNCMIVGTKRNVESEEDEIKNEVAP